MHKLLLSICDPEEVNARAFADQAALIERVGGIEKAKIIGSPSATPPPATN